MHQFESYRQFIESHIKQIEFPSSPDKLYDPLRYFLSIGGKRTRPMLTLLACELFGGNKEKAINTALAIELFHNFTLIHDDIMDEAPLRRGNETIHTKWNRDIAILSGDVLFAKAYEMLTHSSSNRLQEMLIEFNEMAKSICEGQQYDMDFESSENVSLPDYIEMIRLKTSVLLGTALKLGAIVVGVSEQMELNRIYDFGINIGIAFQIQDDILDLYTTSHKFGKQIGGDILANKKTFLFLKAVELADINTKGKLLDYLQLPNDRNTDKVGKVKRLFDELNVKKEAIQEKQLYYNKAMGHLNKINVPFEQKNTLITLAQQLLMRKY